jgi:hypothetical protein
MRDRGRMGKGKVPAAIEWLPGPRELTYAGLEDTDCTIIGAKVNRSIPG